MHQKHSNNTSEVPEKMLQKCHKYARPQNASKMQQKCNKNATKIHQKRGKNNAKRH